MHDFHNLAFFCQGQYPEDLGNPRKQIVNAIRPRANNYDRKIVAPREPFVSGEQDVPFTLKGLAEFAVFEATQSFVGHG